MSERNYWTSLRRRKISRRTMLQASGRAGVGAAGLALVGCGDDDDDDDAATAATDQAEEQAEEQAQAQADDQAEEQAQAEQAVDDEEAEEQAEEQAEQVEEEEEEAEEAEEEEQAVATGEIDTEATLRLALAADNGGLDPHRSGSQVNYQNSHGVFSRPVEFAPETGNPVGNLVSWELPDDVTWNITVKDNIFFHNGQQLTAEDLIFTYERVGNIAEYHQGGRRRTTRPAGPARARNRAPTIGRATGRPTS